MSIQAKILVIDDEKSIRDMLSLALGKHGHTVLTAQNGKEGLEKSKQDKIDLAIVDINMPEIDGIAFLGEIKKIDPETDVIVMTGYGTAEKAIASLKLGASDFINKPAKLEEIFASVEKILEKKELKRKFAWMTEELKKSNVELEKAKDNLEEKVKERTAELERSEAKYRKIADDSFDPIISLNNKKEIKTWSKGAELTFGYKDYEVLGELINTLTPPAKIEEESQMFSKLTEKGFIKNWITQRVTKEGRVIDVNITMSLLGAEGVSVVLRDITREKEIDRMKTDFVSNVSHELRTPLTSVKGAVELLLKKIQGELTPSQEEFLTIIKKNTSRLIRLINDLLDLSKIESGRIEMQMKLTRLVPLINEVIETTKPLAEEKNIILKAFLPDESLAISFDEDKIKQVLINLIGNSVKFTPSAGRISIIAEDKEKEVQIAVTDTGIGIAQENWGKIFEKFQQVDTSATRAAGGTGLGLAISKSIIEAHQGKIWLESELGKGSKFILTLPKMREKDIGETLKQTLPAEIPISPLVYKPAFTIKKVLVIDDDIDLARVIKGHLEEGGYGVITAHSGLDGIKMALTYQPDIITLDILMPHMDGFTVAEILRQNPKTKNIPIIIVSVVQEKEKGYRLGVADYITKPFDPIRLVDGIKKVEVQINQEKLSKRILIVDDEPDTVSILTALLAEQGYLTFKAYDGIEAIMLAKREKPDIIILDLMMPEMDGFEVIKKLKSDIETNQIPIVVLTARDLKTDKIKALELGATEYLTKPFSTENLLTEIMEALSPEKKSLLKERKN
jgi:PAS domain S-box-containing protein